MPHAEDKEGEIKWVKSNAEARRHAERKEGVETRRCGGDGDENDDNDEDEDMIDCRASFLTAHMIRRPSPFLFLNIEEVNRQKSYQKH